MSEWADNYNSNATSDDGSCFKEGCMLDYMDNYDELATVDDGSCYKYGCMLDWADNYDPYATTDYYNLPEEFTGNTGDNMTVFFTSDVIGALPISSAILLYFLDGLIVGSANVLHLKYKILFKIVNKL